MAKQLELPGDEVLEEAAECLKVMAHPVRLKTVSYTHLTLPTIYSV